MTTLPAPSRGKCAPSRSARHTHSYSLSHPCASTPDLHLHALPSPPRPTFTSTTYYLHFQAREATLLVEHVVALRLYTTAAYKSINDPLRGRGQYGDGPHPFPVSAAALYLPAVCSQSSFTTSRSLK